MLCGAEDFSDLPVPACGITMRRCRDCGFWVNGDFATYQEDDQHYDASYHQTHYGRSDGRKCCTSRYLVRQIEALAGSRGRLVDVGCSFAHFVQAATDRGWDAYGVDISEDMVRRGQALGLQIQPGGLRDLPFPDGYFNVVHARHVLEHDIEVWQSLGELRRALAPGGLLALTVPDADCPKVCRRGGAYAKFWKPDHLVAFTRPTLAEFLRRAGFTPVPCPTFAGAGNAGPGGLLPFVAWRLASLVPDALGQGKTIVSFWQKSGEPDWPTA
jgi:SAM-dependent methyltransferase